VSFRAFWHTKMVWKCVCISGLFSGAPLPLRSIYVVVTPRAAHHYTPVTPQTQINAEIN